MTTPTTTVFGITFDEAAILWEYHVGDVDTPPDFAEPTIAQNHAVTAYCHGHWPDHNITTDSELDQHWSGWYESRYGE